VNDPIMRVKLPGVEREEEGPLPPAVVELQPLRPAVENG
jgi:hypothetical protein